MKLKHYSVFKVNTTDVIDWNSLRDEEQESHYCLPNSREKYLLKVSDGAPSDSVLMMIRQIQELKYKKVLSLGCGIAHTEYLIQENSDLQVTVSDNTESIKRLKSYGVFYNALSLDILLDDFPVNNETIILMHRIDTEFNDAQMMSIFSKCKKLGVKHICFVPTDPVISSIIKNEAKTLILSIIKNRKRTFCGYCRSKSSLIKLWTPFYKLIFEYKDGKPFYIIEIVE